ncbi:hypothetical protein AAG906_032210 [Vitis piasezkii]
MAVKVEKSDWERKKKRKSLHNERKLFNDEKGEVMRGGIGSSTVVNFEEPDCGRERTGNKRKLLVGEEVEVRSVEEGLLGSWHSGTIIGCDYLVRNVKYNEILDDRMGERFLESVSVSGAIEGTSVVDTDQCNHRGRIRPLPPQCDFGKWNLHYGLCVDVFFREAWWEGVIFDHEDGLENRKVFFPDLGDELTVGVDSIRITQDWNEGTATWERRRNWLFLELIEEYEQDWPLNVSLKQIWYDVREKKGFEKVKEWTCPSNALWRELVREAIADNFRITLNKICSMLKPEVLANCHAVELIRGISPLDGSMMMTNNDANATNSGDYSIGLVDKLVENGGLATRFQYTDPKCSSNQHVQEKHEVDGVIPFVENSGLDMPYRDKEMSVQPQPLLVIPSKPNKLENFTFDCKSEGYSNNPSANRKNDWRRVDTDILHGAESCFDAIIEYALISSGKRKPPNSLTENVRKHLSYLGWKIEFMNKDVPRFRYTSPEGKTYLSLRQVCQDLRRPAAGIDSPISQDDQRSLLSPYDDLAFPLVKLQVNDLSSQLIEKSQVSKGKWTVPSHDDRVDIDHEYCPQAVVNYYFLGLDKKEHHSRKDDIRSLNLKSKAKKHLSFMGWTFWYAYRRGKREMRYFSPKGKCYYSLRTACKGCMDEGGASEGTSTTCNPVKTMNVSEVALGQELSSALIDMRMQNSLIEQNVPSAKWPIKSSSISQLKSKEISAVTKKRHDGLHGVTSNSLQCWTQSTGKDGFGIGLVGDRELRHPKDKNVCFSKLKNGKGSKALMRLNGLDGTRVLRSRKRARQVLIPGSSNNPRTILSWLIDNNVVLPRAKVHYSSRRDHHPMADGRITRDGIKCSCCQEVFSLSRFEAHAGSSYHRSAANIFLEDGRSLLECQMQIIRDITGKGFTKESFSRKKSNERHHENDHICSVCHYGGDLVLCDHCPSSFHKSCLGLKTLPEGDWFCPSCCCGICGENKFDGGSEQDNVVFSCYQCERQYHVGCLRKWGHVKLASYPHGTWFCSKQCKKIFLGLQKLVGKSFPVGVDNLTWTLLKPIRSEGLEIDLPDIEALTEVYSKLNIALGVMHECFEPVKEPHTRRDVVEDVIFCRGSDLNRLNFQGFYTVLLERNDELISVATVRVYGEKVAEVPLIGTRFQYRRLGMCHILMNELEKKLMELGVERLVLPAVPSVLNTWTTSFGFSKMTDSERLRFLDYSFLDFQDTVMCQKLLMKIPLAKSNQSTGAWSKHIIDFNKRGAISEALKSEQVEAEIVAPGPSDTSSKGGDGSNSLPATQQTDPEHKLGLNENNLECLLKDDNHKGRDIGNGYFKCYKRRRILSASGS